MKKYKLNHIRNLKSRLRRERRLHKELVEMLDAEEKNYDNLVDRVERVCGKNTVALPAKNWMHHTGPMEVISLPRPIKAALATTTTIEQTIHTKTLYQLELSADRVYELGNMLHLRLRYRDGQSNIAITPEAFADRNLIPIIAEELVVSLQEHFAIQNLRRHVGY